MLFFNVPNEDEFNLLHKKIFASKKYEGHNYVITQELPTYKEMCVKDIGNNLNPNGTRFWADLSNLKRKFHYTDFFKFLLQLRGENLIEFASLNFVNPSSPYAHFNFKSSLHESFGFDEKKKRQYLTYQGEKIYLKQNRNKTPKNSKIKNE